MYVDWTADQGIKILGLLQLQSWRKVSGLGSVDRAMAGSVLPPIHFVQKGFLEPGERSNLMRQKLLAGNIIFAMGGMTSALMSAGRSKPTAMTTSPLKNEATLVAK